MVYDSTCITTGHIAVTHKPTIINNYQRQNIFIRMKNLFVCGLLAAGCCFSAASQSKLSGSAQIMLMRHNSEKALSRAADTTEVMAFITLNKGYDAEALRAKGLTITSDFGDICIVSLPLSRAEEIASMNEVKAVEFGEQSGIMMDRARTLSSVDQVHAGDPTTSNISYTGQGVITGLYDTGLDPNHAAFRKADGTSRVQAIFLAKGYQNATVTEYTTPDAISKFETDTRYETHGTHVAGIMAGSKGIIGDYAQSSGSSTIRDNGEIPYYGVAYNSDLVIGCGDFYDASIMAGVEKVVNFAKSQGKPAVVNLSLGGNSGAHDPNSTVSKLMDRLGEDAIICIAAGNEGEEPMAIQKEFNPRGTAGKQLNTFLTPQYQDRAAVYTAEFWSDTDAPFTCELVLYDKLKKDVVARKAISTGTTRWTAADGDEFKNVFTSSSSVNASCGVDPVTNRFYVNLNNSLQYNGGASLVVLGVNIKGTPGNKCYAYINTARNAEQKTYFTTEGVSGYTAGTPDGTINGFGCGHNMVSVGAWVSRTSAPYIGTGSYSGGGVQGQIAPFSSYGQTGDGRQLPHVAAPGAQIVSAYSQFYFDEAKMEKDRTCAFSETFGRKNAYYPMQGTSMATPFAAGVIALWLEANPNLTITDVQNIIKETSDPMTSSVEDIKRFGAGKINAIKGIVAALNTSIKGTIADQADKNLMYTLSGKQLTVVIPGVENYGVQLVNLQGATVLATTAQGNTADLDATGIADGIYLLTADTNAGKVTRKIVLK